MDVDIPGRLHADDDGFLLLVVRGTYSGFVDADWTLEALQAHVAHERAAGHVFGVHLGPDGASRPIEVRRTPSGALVPPGPLEVTARQLRDGSLWVPDHTALTMAAQFADEPLVDPRRTPHLLVPPGPLEVTARQLREDRDGGAVLELVLSAAVGIGWLDL